MTPTSRRQIVSEIKFYVVVRAKRLHFGAMIFSFYVKILYIYKRLNVPSIMEELIRHTRTSYAGLAMSKQRKLEGKAAKGAQDDEVGTYQSN